MRILVLSLLLIVCSCSKKSDPTPTVPDIPVNSYIPTQSATYEMKSLEYGYSLGGQSVRMEFWRILYDSAGVVKTIDGLPGNNDILSFQHSDFIESISVESPDAIYDAHWPDHAFSDWNMAKKKENSYFMTNPKSNQIDIVFKNGVNFKFRIGAGAHIGVTISPPGAELLRMDKSAVVDFMKNKFCQIQDKDSVKAGVQPRHWNVAIMML